MCKALGSSRGVSVSQLFLQSYGPSHHVEQVMLTHRMYDATALLTQSRTLLHAIKRSIRVVGCALAHTAASPNLALWGPMMY